MKYGRRILFLGFVMAQSPLNLDAGDGPVRVLSFNIRYGTASDGDNAWPRRSDLVGDVIRERRPDFCGLQEALRFQIDAIHAQVPGYAEHGRARDDGQDKGEYSAILYRKDRWSLEQGDTVWLSATPDTPGSTSWGNSIPRIVSWGEFVDRKSGNKLFVFNSHFDHRSQPSRLQSARFLTRLIAEKAAGQPVVVTGDFNAGEQNPAIRHMIDEGALRDTFRVVHPDATGVGTFNGFSGRTDGEKIDFVLVGRAGRVLSAEIVRTHRNSRYPSDHFPVSAEVQFTH